MTSALLLFFATFPSVIMCFGLYVLKNTYLTMGAYHLLCLVPGIIIGRTYWLRDLKLPSIKTWILTLIAAVLFNVLTITIFDHFGYVFIDNAKVMKLISDLGFAREHLLALSFYFIFVNSFLEELFWRGVLLNKLNEMKLPFQHAGIVISSVLYGFYHYFILRIIVNPGWAEVGFIQLTVYGAMLAVIYRKTKSIIVPSLVHGLLTDAAAMLLTLDLVQRFPPS